MSEADYLVGVEEYELAFVEDVLDDAPVDAQTVYKETIDMSERAIAAEAAYRTTTSGGGGGPPTGAAGGVLGGTYPNPGFAADMATQAELDAHVNDATDAHDATAISILDTANDFTATDVEAALAELQADNEAHVAEADPHAGYVLESLYDANTVLAADSDNTPAALTLGASTILARLAAGNIKAASVSEIRTLLDVPTNAEAILDTLFDANTVLKADSDNTPAALTMGASTVLARLAAGSIVAATPTEIRTLLDVPTTGEAILDALVDAKGDLILGTAADTVARLAAGANGTVPTYASGETTGMIPALPPGYQYNRVTITTNATFTASSAATANTLITCGAVTPGAGVAVRVIAQAAALGSSGGNSVILTMWRSIDGAAAVDLGFVAQQFSLAGSGGSIHGEVDDTPGAGSIVYTLRGWATGGDTGTLYATAGSGYTPASLRIVRV